MVWYSNPECCHEDLCFPEVWKTEIWLRKPQVLAFIRCGGLSDSELPSRARRYLKCKFRKRKLKEDIKEQQHSKNWASENLHKKNGHL